MRHIFRILLVLLCTIPIDTYATPREKERGVSPWIDSKKNIYVYKFNVFNLDPENVDRKKLKSIIKANVKDIERNFKKDWRASADIKIYSADQLSNPKLFEGDRIPFFIVNTAPKLSLGFHANQANSPANEKSILKKGSSIADKLGLDVPSNFPAWTPYAAVETFVVKASAQINQNLNNPYGIQDFYQLLSVVISHELKEAITDDSGQNWCLFDSYAPTVATWHYGEFDANGVCTNGTLGADGYVHLPLLSDVLPKGGLITAVQETTDPVSLSAASLLNSYQFDGWSMSNYTTSNFWKGYYESSQIKWDKKGFVEAPLQPFAGVHEIILFLDLSTGLTFYGSVNNWGPVTYAQRGDPVENNFPPDYTYISFTTVF